MTKERYILFQLGQNLFATELLEIKEVLSTNAEFVPIPHSSEHCLGVFNLRGNITTVLDLKGKLAIYDFAAPLNMKKTEMEDGNVQPLHGEEDKEENENFIMVLGHPETDIGLLVDKILSVSVLSIDDADINVSKTGLGKAEKYLRGLVNHEGSIVAVIDLVSLISDEDIRASLKNAG